MPLDTQQFLSALLSPKHFSSSSFIVEFLLVTSHYDLYFRAKTKEYFCSFY